MELLRYKSATQQQLNTYIEAGNKKKVTIVFNFPDAPLRRR
jgi:hypothetical protein